MAMWIPPEGCSFQGAEYVLREISVAGATHLSFARDTVLSPDCVHVEVTRRGSPPRVTESSTPSPRMAARLCTRERDPAPASDAAMRTEAWAPEFGG